MKRQGGFTLIELVVVIVILGILAVTAAPKFLNLQTDAREATLNGFKGSMQGASSMVYAKAALAGKETGTDVALDVGTGTDIVVTNGYPSAVHANFIQVLDVDFANDFSNILHTEVSGGVATNLYYTLESLDNDLGTTALTNCYVTYTIAAENGVPTITVTACE